MAKQHDSRRASTKIDIDNAIVRNKRKHHFTTVPNSAIQNKALTPKALALFVVMLSLPDAEDGVSLSDIRHQHIMLSPREAAEALKELKLSGYVDEDEVA